MLWPVEDIIVFFIYLKLLCELRDAFFVLLLFLCLLCKFVLEFGDLLLEGGILVLEGGILVLEGGY